MSPFCKESRKSRNCKENVKRVEKVQPVKENLGAAKEVSCILKLLPSHKGSKVVTTVILLLLIIFLLLLLILLLLLLLTIIIISCPPSCLLRKSCYKLRREPTQPIGSRSLSLHLWQSSFLLLMHCNGLVNNYGDFHNCSLLKVDHYHFKRKRKRKVEHCFLCEAVGLQ